jgi:tetratricopeptide (TPR) repeat protein
MAHADVRAAARAVLLLDHDGDIDEALARAHELAVAHPESAIAHRLVGDLRYAAAIHVAGRDYSEEVKQRIAGVHLRVARDALITARRLAPDCVDIAAALGDVFCASKLYDLAESEFRRAERIACPSDPAENNAGYGLYEQVENAAAERVEEARERARRSYARMTVEELVPFAVKRVLDAASQHGAAEGLKQGKRVAEAFPNLARAQYLNAYMDLEFVRSLDASIDKRPFLRRTLTVAERVAQAFPNSTVIASFHARLLFVLGEYHAAERECRRALSLKEPDDPNHDCIPPGSIRGENCGARLVSLASQFHELLHKILMLANDYWSSMSSERRETFLSVRFDALQDEYRKVNSSSSVTMYAVQTFVKEKGSWWFWVCPICDSNKYLDPEVLLSHLCSKHPRVVLPRLQSVLNPKLSENALDSDGYLGGVSLSQDSDQKDVIKFDRRSEAFKWLFYAPSSGIVPKPFLEVREFKRQQGNMVLEKIKEKMKTMPANKSTTEV